MAEGHLRCAGSSLFLKKMYGVGYQLTIEKNTSISGNSKILDDRQEEFEKISDVSEVYTDSFTQYGGSNAKEVIFDADVFEKMPMVLANSSLISLVKGSVPEATLLNDVGTEVRFQLPIGSADKFSAMFENLDHEVDQGNIVSYGVSITTLGTCIRPACCGIFRCRYLNSMF
jgi:ATP-binding cassette, subfamily A (ABC1), member 3